jgi:uncharacterized protein YxjI
MEKRLFMDLLTDIKQISVKQQKEWGEILSGFETKNKFMIYTETGQELFYAAEESSFFARMFFKTGRPFTMHVLSKQGEPVLKLLRPWRFWLSEMTVFAADGQILGTIKQHFRIFSREFSVFDNSGFKIFGIYGSLLHPWTFRVLKNSQEVGKILKKWSGLGKEMFTDADNFNISFPDQANPGQKSVLMGALFLIDMLYFEKKK